MSAQTKPNAIDELDPLHCPSFQLTPKESGVIWLLWWGDDGRSKALLEPITNDDHYQVGLVFKPGTQITYQHGDPYTADPSPRMIPDALRDIITTVCGITIVDVDTEGRE
jgi:hypothetical protein